jgi:hypothetical protein
MCRQGGDGPLMPAALMGSRIPMMELVTANGRDAKWNGYYPIDFCGKSTIKI